MKALKVLLVIILVLGISVAMGKAPRKAAAQDGVVITPTSIDRLGGPNTTVKIEDNNDMDTVSTPDGNYLAMLVTTTRLPVNGEPCRMLYPPPYPGAPCLVKERMLIVYDTTTEPDTLIGYRVYPSGGYYPYVVKFVRLDGQLSVAVLERYPFRLGFYNPACQEVDQTLLPENFGDQYYLDGYMDFDVAYLGNDPFIIAAGGVVIDDPTEAQSGLKVGVAQDPGTGNFVVTWTEIGDCAGMITQIDSGAGGDGTVTSALVYEEYVDDDTVKNQVITQIGITRNSPGIPGFQYAAYRQKGDSFMAEGIESVVNHLQKIVVICTDRVNLDDGTRKVVAIPVIDAVQQPAITVAEGVPGVSVSGRGIFASYDPATENILVGVAGITDGLIRGCSDEIMGGTDIWLAAFTLDRNMNVLSQRVDIHGGPGDEVCTAFGTRYRANGRKTVRDCEVAVSVDSGHEFFVGTHSSQPIGGPPGGTDVVMIEFEICTAPVAFASLTKIDNGDEEGDEDEGLFEVSFGSGAFDCEPVTCTAELVCEGGSSVAVENGQLVEIEMEDDECEIEYEDGRLEIQGRIRLEVTCTNEAGTSVATAEPEGLAADDDDEDEEDEDED